jgi:hypothetical protein
MTKNAYDLNTCCWSWKRLTTGDAGTGQMVGGGRLRGVLHRYELYIDNSKTERRGGSEVSQQVVEFASEK